jgi:hypothetical protein
MELIAEYRDYRNRKIHAYHFLLEPQVVLMTYVQLMHRVTFYLYGKVKMTAGLRSVLKIFLNLSKN